MNQVAIMGRLTSDPEFRHTQSGTAVASFTLAVDGGKEKDSNDRVTDFIDCTAWANTAEFISKFFSKGRMMAVAGSLKTRNWTDKENNRRKSTEVRVDNAYFADSKKTGDKNTATEDNDDPPY